MEKEVIMIANHNQLFHFSDPSKSVETLTSRRLDWSWSVTKLKAIFQILFVQVFLLLVKETKFKIFIGFFRIERFPFSIAMEAPPHLHAEAPLKIIGFR